MLKVSVIGCRLCEDGVVERLQRAGAVDITEVELPEGAKGIEQLRPDDERRRRLDEWAADAHFVRDFLARYHRPTHAFSMFVSEKFHLTVDDFLSFDDPSGMLPLYRECEEISDRIASLSRERTRLRALIADLAPWRDVRLQISRWRGTDHVALFAGTVPGADSTTTRQALRDCCKDVSVEEHGPVGSRAAWIVLVHKAFAEPVRQVLAAADFVEACFPGLTDYPAEEAEVARDRLEELEIEVDELEARSRDLAARQFSRAVAMSEAIDAEREALLVRERFVATRSTFALSGWVRQKDHERLELALEPLAGEVDVTLTAPREGDSPPVELDNPRWLKPFEVLTDLYGRPPYGSLDPTPLLAPFFLLFFGICVGDVGYGAMLIAGAWLVKHRLDVAKGVKRFCDLMMIGGVMAMVVGALTGSWFAISVDALPPVLRGVMVIDPMKDLLLYLGITVALGLTQVVFGVLVAAYDAWRKGDFAGAVNDQLSTLFLLGTIAVAALAPRWSVAAITLGLGVTVLMKGHTVEKALTDPELPVAHRVAGGSWVVLVTVWLVALAFKATTPALAWTLAGATVVGLLVSKGVRRGVVAVLGGAYEVYGLSAFIGDVLSYTRLAALGLSGALVGSVFNLMAGMVWGPVAGLWRSGGAGIVGAIVIALLGALVAVVGHTFNVVINLLGAFVHPARLQFVEFFSKFYEGGGRVFDPLRLRTRSVVLGPVGPAGQEGGT